MPQILQATYNVEKQASCINVSRACYREEMRKCLKWCYICKVSSKGVLRIYRGINMSFLLASTCASNKDLVPLTTSTLADTRLGFCYGDVLITERAVNSSEENVHQISAHRWLH